jgi:hypothetical protein
MSALLYDDVLAGLPGCILEKETYRHDEQNKKPADGMASSDAREDPSAGCPLRSFHGVGLHQQTQVYTRIGKRQIIRQSIVCTISA